MKVKLSLAVAFASLFFSWLAPAQAQDLDHALMLYQHNILDEAKTELIDILFERGTDADTKADCLYWLGMISFEERNFQATADDWAILISDYPDSYWVDIISDQLEWLQDFLAMYTDTMAESATAQAYLDNGDFWSDAEYEFGFENWRMRYDLVALSCEWYDRVIEEFPGSLEAEIAYRRKFYTYLGWDSFSIDGAWIGSYGAQDDFAKYMPKAVEVYDEFITQFPDSYWVQIFRLEIAKAYWARSAFDEARPYLDQIIEDAAGEETLITQIVREMLGMY